MAYHRIGDQGKEWLKMRAFCCWSGGKDAGLSFYEAEKMGIEICCLVNMVSADGKRSRSHGVSAQLLKCQAQAMEISIIQKAVGKSYEEEFKKAITVLKDRDIQTGVFGDIDVQEHRDWVEKVSGEMGIKAVFPLWRKRRKALLEEFIDNKFKAIIVAVKSGYLSKDYLGREVDDSLIKDLRKLKNVNLCGERGEYHTLLYDGPIFRKRLVFSVGEKTSGDKYWFLDVNPLSIMPVLKETGK